MSDVPDLALAVGRRMRRLRDEHGVTADAIATHARRFGLNWQRSTVATIEAGRRRLTGEELLLLPLLLSTALPVAVNLRDLLDAEIAMTPDVVMTPNGFKQLLAEKTSIYGGYKLRRGGVSEGQQPSVATWQRIEQLWPDVHGGGGVNLERLRMVERAAAGEAEQNAARTLGWSAIDVAAVAHRMWGHGLTVERDRRVSAGGVSDEGVAAVRARRGHVTRALLDELTGVMDSESTPEVPA